MHPLEKDVLDLLLDDAEEIFKRRYLTDKEIARELVISPLTVHKHVANILGKMNAASRTEAGVRALREGLLD